MSEEGTAAPRHGQEPRRKQQHKQVGAKSPGLVQITRLFSELGFWDAMAASCPGI